MFIHGSMAKRASLQRRQALGLLNGNTFTHRFDTPRSFDSDFGHEKLRRESQVSVLGKHLIDFLDDAQVPKTPRYTEVPDKRLGIEHWLEDGVVEGDLSCSPVYGDDTIVLEQPTAGGRDQSLGDFMKDTELPLATPEVDERKENQEKRSTKVDKDCYEGRPELDSPVFPQAGKPDYPLIPSLNPETSLSAFSSSAAARALRLRLRVALFKVQTNQTAIPISHLQLPEASPQPLSVFPPSLVRVSTDRNVHDGYLNEFFYDDETTTAPPSSPPPITVAGAHLHDLPFLVPTRAPSPPPGPRSH